MAEKSTKKTAAATESVKTIESLQSEVATKRQDLLEAVRSNAAGELVNPRVIKSYRKDIARLLTQINERKGE
ncbi:50S ribosomal protein L29 [Candidatus Saccharibacteria bacterium 32-49-12]|nr:MAG: 50S ribosomal protein L29 [Candidatus Saccharibacteria bacterium 32-49-12]